MRVVDVVWCDGVAVLREVDCFVVLSVELFAE